MNEIKNEQELDYENLINSNFKQQKVASWRPVPSKLSILIFYTTVGLFFITIGVIINVLSSDLLYLTINYSSCSSEACEVKFNLNQSYSSPIYFYYQLDGFHQNDNRYISSKSYSQLSGNIIDNDHAEKDCFPIIKNSELPNGTKSLSGKELSPSEVAFPCGLIARSFFNDTYELYDSTFKDRIFINETNIALEYDRDLLYKLPDNTSNFIIEDNLWMNTTNEHFIVWMRSSGLPKFRKLWGRIENDLAKGEYIIKINRNYKINFGGETSIVIANSSVFGSKNTFLGTVLIIVGCIFFITLVVMYVGFRGYSNKTKNKLKTN